MFETILLIAGKGERTNLTYNKVFYKILNKSLFRYSLETFLNCKECNKVIIVTTPYEIKQVKDEIKDLDTHRIQYTYGGLMRQDSVFEGVKLATRDIILIHDGARPLVQEEQIIAVYESVKQYSSAVLAVKTTDTIKELRDGKLYTLNRDLLWNIQTPQGLKLDLYKKAIEMAQSEKYYGTDDVSLIEKYLNISPKIVEGSYENIKATTKADLEYIEYLIRRNLNGF